MHLEALKTSLTLEKGEMMQENVPERFQNESAEMFLHV